MKCIFDNIKVKNKSSKKYTKIILTKRDESGQGIDYGKYKCIIENARYNFL